MDVFVFAPVKAVIALKTNCARPCGVGSLQTFEQTRRATGRLQHREIAFDVEPFWLCQIEQMLCRGCMWMRMHGCKSLEAHTL